MTAVSRQVLQQLGLQAALQASTHTAAGSLPVVLYRISLGVTDFADSTAPSLVVPSLLVMDLANPIPDVDVLVGLDVLLQCKMMLDGPGGQFSLEF